MTTRRDVLTGIAAASVPYIGIGSPVRNIIGARSIETMDSGVPMTNPYITDGLVAMFDGEWNAALGRHNPNATIWRDLVGNSTVRPYYSSQSLLFGDNYASARGLLFTVPGFLEIKNNGEWTIQVCETTEYSVENYMPRITICGSTSMLIYEGNRSITTLYSTSQLRMSDTKEKACRTIVVTNGQYRVHVNDKTSAWKSVGTNDKGNDLIGVFCYIINNYRIYTGRCSRFAIYNRALTTQEIQQNYEIDKKRFGL